MHNAAQNSSDNFPSYPPVNHHSSYVGGYVLREIVYICVGHVHDIAIFFIHEPFRNGFKKYV